MDRQRLVPDVDNVIWEHIRSPNAKLWLVCARDTEMGRVKPILIPYSQAFQEPYVEAEEQHEGVLNLFTTPGGADRYKERLAATGENQSLVVKRIGVDDLMKLIKNTDEAYQAVKRHSIRVDVYDIRGLTPRREVLYTRWAPKH